jgi:hypothetical protein
MFRAALSDKAATRTEVIDIQYFLARTLEAAGQMTEAATLYCQLARANPRFKDVAHRAHELSPKVKYLANRTQWAATDESWFSNAIKGFPRWPLLASR